MDEEAVHDELGIVCTEGKAVVVLSIPYKGNCFAVYDALRICGYAGRIGRYYITDHKIPVAFFKKQPDGVAVVEPSVRCGVSCHACL